MASLIAGSLRISSGIWLRALGLRGRSVWTMAVVSSTEPLWSFIVFCFASASAVLLPTNLRRGVLGGVGSESPWLPSGSGISGNAPGTICSLVSASMMYCGGPAQRGSGCEKSIDVPVHSSSGDLEACRDRHAYAGARSFLGVCIRNDLTTSACEQRVDDQHRRILRFNTDWKM